MANFGIIIDVILFAILIFSAWKGWKKGLILTVSGIAAVIIAFWGSSLIADSYAEMFTPALKPFVSGQVDKAVDNAQKSFDESLIDTADTYDIPDEVRAVSEEALQGVGFLSTAAANLADELSETLNETGYKLKSAMVDRITITLSKALVMTVSFIVIIIVFTIIANIVNLAFKLPGLKLINEIGGVVCGLLKGLLLCFAISWVVRFIGFFVPEEAVQHDVLQDAISHTLLLRLLISINPLSGIFGI
ncbi:MAG: CvpA family protein [Oscillospiraceae bacterium]|jgi:uncharacterized membrane protein required for colicin V production|nr:CvpA family protein [Oscillospiraceae bacterium]